MFEIIKSKNDESTGSVPEKKRFCPRTQAISARSIKVVSLYTKVAQCFFYIFFMVTGCRTLSNAFSLSV